jgi:hypothetical protein
MASIGRIPQKTTPPVLMEQGVLAEGMYVMGEESTHNKNKKVLAAS